jgi:hypothetical protein
MKRQAEAQERRYPSHRLSRRPQERGDTRIRALLGECGVAVLVLR